MEIHEQELKLIETLDRDIMKTITIIYIANIILKSFIENSK